MSPQHAAPLADERFMKVIESVSEARAYCRAQREASRKIALVPTMGYLHAGHLALVERARSVADIVVATIFVNPTQFAAGEDLAAYPRDPEGDRRKLEEAGCDMLFLPRAGELHTLVTTVRDRLSFPRVCTSLRGLRPKRRRPCRGRRPRGRSGVCRMAQAGGGRAGRAASRRCRHPFSRSSALRPPPPPTPRQETMR